MPEAGVLQRYYPPQSIRILGEGLFSKKFRTQKAEGNALQQTHGQVD